MNSIDSIHNGYHLKTANQIRATFNQAFRLAIDWIHLLFEDTAIPLAMIFFNPISKTFVQQNYKIQQNDSTETEVY